MPHKTFYKVNTMHHAIIRFLLTLLCCLPTYALAATDYSIHAEWTGYTAPSGLTVTGFNLYQEGVLACQAQGASATSVDCLVSLEADTTNFTLAAVFSNGTESPKSSSFAFTPPVVITPPVSVTSTIHAEWAGYTAPSGYTKSGFNLYQEGVLACQTQSATATSLDCTVSLSADTTNFTLTAAFSNGTESPHSAPFAFTKPSGTVDPLQAAVTANPTSGTAPLAVTFNGSTSTGNITSYQWDFGDGSTGTGASPSHTYTTAGSHTAKLTVSNASSQTSVATTVVTIAAPINTTPPTAVFSASTTGGVAPLAVTFNGSGSTAASGNSIASYAWSFGDGSTASGSTASHSFTSAGTYTTTLTVTDNRGLTSTASTTTTVTAPVVLVPPTAVVSSSTAAGSAPLAVTFNGSGSTAASGSTIASYAWSFGDGTTATGASASHSFTSAGTYTTTLTVTDNKGLTNSASTPIVVSAAPVVNKVPTAVVSATPTSGTSPLVASFDGSASTDSDGTIASYIWNFGDGSTASGPKASHTYTTKATFNATLTVTDNKGASNTSSTTISVQDTPQAIALNIEVGEVSVTSNWVRVPITSTFENPIVIAGPPSYNVADPSVIRVRNVSKTGFEIMVDEWNYLDGAHTAESVRYLVMEKGRTTLPDGSIVEAGSFTGTTSFKTVKFSGTFAKAPVVLTTIASMNETDTISGRIKGIGLTSFAYYFREQEKNVNTHANETVNYIAWEPGKGTIGSLQFEVATTGNSVTNAWYTRAFQSTFSQMPMVLADMQSTNGTDTAALRMQKITATNFQVKVEEEQSKDSEVVHGTETVGYLAISLTEDK